MTKRKYTLKQIFLDLCLKITLPYFILNVQSCSMEESG